LKDFRLKLIFTNIPSSLKKYAIYFEKWNLEPVGVSPNLVRVRPVEDVIVDDGVIDVPGEGVLKVSVGGKLRVHPLIDFVKDFLNTVCHVLAQDFIRRTWKKERPDFHFLKSSIWLSLFVLLVFCLFCNIAFLLDN